VRLKNSSRKFAFILPKRSIFVWFLLRSAEHLFFKDWDAVRRIQIRSDPKLFTYQDPAPLWPDKWDLCPDPKLSLRIRWEKNAVKKTPSSYWDLFSAQVELGDAGQYECEMNNELGSVKQASFLSVDGGISQALFGIVVLWIRILWRRFHCTQLCGYVLEQFKVLYGKYSHIKEKKVGNNI